MRLRAVLLLITLHILILPCFAQSVLAGSADDNDANTPEIGVEWVEDYPTLPDLSQCSESMKSLKDRLVAKGWSAKFDFGNSMAWEEDWKKSSIGGTDYIYVDAVDLAAFAGHSGNHLRFAVEHDDEYLFASEASWGDGDLEWVFHDSCDTVNDQYWNYWFTHAFSGLHLMCGWNGDCADFNNCTHVADLLIDDGWWDWARKVLDAWLVGANYNQPWNSPGVIAETEECGDDYIWGQGGVIADPVHDSTAIRWCGYL